MKAKFIATAQLFKQNKRVGFVITQLNSNGNIISTQNMSDEQIKNLINSGENFDITFNSRGFRFKNTHRRLQDLPVIKIGNNSINSIATQNEHQVVVQQYTGEKLRQFINASNINDFKKRDFVEAILEYVKAKENRVLSISGLRGTGKTTGILQAIFSIDNYRNAVYISIDETANMNCLDLRNLIMNNYNNKKYIFIDEITRVNDFIKNSGFLADLLVMSGKKIIVSGTDSLGLSKSESAGLYHRVININVTHISFAEAQRTMGQSLKEYTELGGLYRADSITDIDGLREYVDTAVIDNIVNTLTRNKDITGLLGLSNIGSKQKLRTIVFRIIYAIIYCNLQKPKNTSVKSIINFFDISKSQLYDYKTLNSLVCSEMLVDEDIYTNKNEVQSVLNAMESIGILVKTVNICNRTECKYYITNPSIVNQLAGSIVSILNNTNLPKKSQASFKSKKGLLFESIVVTHTSKAAKKLGYNLFYYHDSNNKELDLIIEKGTDELFENSIVCYEIKMTADSDTAVINSKWINDKELSSYIESNGTVIEKGIIYGGENKIFEYFESNEIYAPKDCTVQQLEQQNKGIKLIKATDYLLHTVEKLKILENYER